MNPTNEEPKCRTHPGSGFVEGECLACRLGWPPEEPSFLELAQAIEDAHEDPQDLGSCPKCGGDREVKAGSTNHACRCEEPDRQVPIYAEELRLLKSVFSKSSDLVLARRDADFCGYNGGLEKMEAEHAEATRTLEQWYDDEE
jgi:hypothetical protein